MSSLPRSAPDSQGLTSSALAAFVAALDASEQELQTVMLVSRGQVVLEAAWSPYRLTDPHLVFSVSKSFTSLGVGLAIDAGLLSLDDQVVSFFDHELPVELSNHLAALRIRHLLTMTTGHELDTIQRVLRDDQMTRRFLALDVEHEPGTHFAYNTGATYLLSVILQRLTGERLVDYLRPRLFEPLGLGDVTWELSPEGVTTGGWGLSLTTEGLARFGQLLLQNGEWEGRQLVPADWIAAATAKQVSNDNQPNVDWQQGYGYQFWRCQYGAYRADGAFGQYCVIFPEYDAVLAVTSASQDMQATLTLVWEHLLPALRGEEVPPVKAPEKLEIPPPSDPAPGAGDGRTHRFEPNDSGVVAVRLDPDGTGTFTLDLAGTVTDLVSAPGDWQEQLVRRPDHHQPGGGRARQLGGRVVTSACANGDAFVAILRFLETPYVLTLSCRPDGDGLAVEARYNVAFGPVAFPLTPAR